MLESQLLGHPTIIYLFRTTIQEIGDSENNSSKFDGNIIDLLGQWQLPQKRPQRKK